MEGIVGTHFLPEPLRTTVLANLPRLGSATWLRCAAHEYRMAAAGFCHVLFFNRLMPWDHAAGWLLHQEAGGYSAHFDGTGYKPAHTVGGLICAPDQASWQSGQGRADGGVAPVRRITAGAYQQATENKGLVFRIWIRPIQRMFLAAAFRVSHDGPPSRTFPV